MIVTLFVLYVGRHFSIIKFPSLSRDVIKKVRKLFKELFILKLFFT